MVGVNKLAQAIERVGFVARQFALWVVPESGLIVNKNPILESKLSWYVSFLRLRIWWEPLWI
jgi:hypothetical protein